MIALRRPSSAIAVKSFLLSPIVSQPPRSSRSWEISIDLKASIHFAPPPCVTKPYPDIGTTGRETTVGFFQQQFQQSKSGRQRRLLHAQQKSADVPVQQERTQCGPEEPQQTRGHAALRSQQSSIKALSASDQLATYMPIRRRAA